MIKILLMAGLVVIPFYELLLRLFPYGMAMVPDLRAGKTFLAMWIALAIGLSAIYEGRMQPCRNKWLIIFLLFVPLSIHLSPRFFLSINGVDLTNTWSWKPFTMMICYFLMFMAVQSADFSRKHRKQLYTVMVGTAVVMAMYCILQVLGFDQFYVAKQDMMHLQIESRQVAGNLGQPTLVAPLMVMAIPFALHLKKRLETFVLILAVIATQSAFGIVGMFVSLLAFACLRGQPRAAVAMILTGFLIAGLIYVKAPAVAANFLKTNGRIGVWANTFELIRNGDLGDDRDSASPFTGVGPGSYTMVARDHVSKVFREVHNDYLQLAFEVGMCGLFIFVMAIILMVKEGLWWWGDLGFTTNGPEIAVLLASFAGIAFIAMGTFVWQLGVHIFTTVLVTGLLHNQLLLKGGRND